MKDYQEAKEIFFRCLGSKVSIDREYGNKYARMKVPSELENLWKKEICDNLLKQIKEKTGCIRMHAVNAYTQIVDSDIAVSFLLNFLNDRTLDTFSMILVLEDLKKYMNLASVSAEYKLRIKETIDRCKVLLLKSKLTIDDSFKSLYYMRDYDFSDDNLIKRINSI